MGRQIGCVLDPFQEDDDDVPVPFQVAVFACPTAHVVEVDVALVQEDEKWVELVAAQGVELRTAEVVGACIAVVVQTGLEVVDLVHEGEILHLGQTLQVTVQASATSRHLYRGLCTIVFH